jgi:hypothetical protein
MLRKILSFLLLLLAFSHLASATDYFISSTGNDTQPGTSVVLAWRTIDRVNSQTFQSGDRILFEGGQTFSGSIKLKGAGTAAQPLIVRSYGQGPATIASGTAAGFYSYNAGGIELRDLTFVGAGRLTTANSGVIFFMDKPSTQLQYLRLDSLDVSGYMYNGINIGSDNDVSGYTDVRVLRSQVHDIGEIGIYSSSQTLAAHHNWYIGYCQAYDIAGRWEVEDYNTGNGIVMAGIDGVTIEHCLAYHNGWLNNYWLGGPVGIWGMSCNNLTIQYCESHHNDSGSRLDGGGFDLDGGCTNSVLQYNYSHDNNGPGFLLAQYDGAPPMHDLTVRYNVSDNDARRSGQGALEIWASGLSTGIDRAAFYNNTVRLGNASDNSPNKAIKVMSCSYTDLSFRNNILQTQDNAIPFSTVCTSNLRMEGNCYWNSNKLVIDWAGQTINDLQTWRDATSQERMSDGRNTGFYQDPQLPSTLTQAPAVTSPVYASGLNLYWEYKVITGTHDFADRLIPAAPTPSSIGAFEAASTGPLPVVLAGFTVQRASAGALLRWATASELHNAYFAVEFSLDGRTFAPLAQVPGQGISQLAHHYEYTDARLAAYPAGTVYYRLRQVDTDGHATYSPVRMLQGTGAAVAQLQVYPSPAATTATVLVAGCAGAAVQLLDVRGQLLATVPASADGTAALPTVGLAAGLYLVRCGTQSTKLLLTQ